MDFKRVDRIEQAWAGEGKQRDIDYVWLAHGKYTRDNPDFEMETPEAENSAPPEGVWAAREAVGRFYSEYIGCHRKGISADRCCITEGCRDGVNAALNYFKNEDDRNILYLVPTFKPLIDIGHHIFEPSRILFLKHFNEPWTQTLENIEATCDRNRIGCIVFANPNNPAGIMYPDTFLAGLGRIGNDKKIWMIEDGAYFLHYAREDQTTILDHCRYGISLITSLKLLLGKHRVGGAVFTESLNPARFAAFVERIPAGHQLWFSALLKKVGFEDARLLKNHMDGMFRMSKKITKIFTQNGFLPLYGAYKGDSIETSIGPVITFTYTHGKGPRIPAAELFDILAKHSVLTTPIDEGFRINSRGISEAGAALLESKMGRIRADLDRYSL